MRTRLLLLACAAGLLAAPPAPGAPAPDDNKGGGPIIALQVKSIDQLLETVKTTAKNFLPDPQYKEFEKEALSKLDLNVIKGIDTKKPIGLYATFDAGVLQGNFEKSSVVALVPATDEKDFVALLAKAGVNPEKKGDVYTIAIPNAPVAASMRFLKGYAYIGIAADKLDPKTLLDPKEVILEKETAAVALRIRIDRIPEDLKKTAIEFIGGLPEMLKGMGAPPELQGILDDYGKMVTRWYKMGFEDGKELVYRLDLDSKTGALVIEMVTEAKPDTPLAKTFANFKPTKNDFTGVVGSDSAGHVLFQTPLFIEEVQSMLVKAIDLGAKKADENMDRGAPPEARAAVAELFKTLDRTVKSGSLDLAASLRGPDKNDLYTAVGAASLKDTAELEKALKAVLKVAPKDVTDHIKVDAFKVGDTNVHEIVVGDKLPPEAQKIFGKSNVYVALAPDAVYVAFGAQGQALMKEVAAMKPSAKPAPLIHAEVSGKRLMTLIKNAGAPMEAQAFLEKFAKIDHLAVLSVKMEGGKDKLIVREDIGLLPLIGLFGVSAKSEFKPVAPPKAVPAVEKK